MNTTFKRPFPRAPRFSPSRDKMARMGKRNSARKNGQKKEPEREQWRIPMTPEEAARVEADSLDLELNHGPTKAAYMRHLLLSPLDPSVPVPDFAPVEVEVARPTRPSVRLRPSELEEIKEAARALGIDAKRYARWRLLGVLE